MLKKYFDWTPRDVAQWEKLRQKGMGRFIVWYGLISGGIIFIFPAVWTLAALIKALLEGAAAKAGYLALELLATAALCVPVGIIIALATWVMEEKIYQQKYVQHKENNENRKT